MGIEHDVRMKLDINMLEINAALDRGERRRFALLCKRRRDLQTKLGHRQPEGRGADVSHQ